MFISLNLLNLTPSCLHKTSWTQKVTCQSVPMTHQAHSTHSLFIPAIQKTKALHAGMSNMLKENITSGQRRVLHFAAVGSHELVRVVHTAFCGIIIHDDPWFSMLLATNSPIPVQRTHEYHILAFLWHIGYKGRVSVSTNLKDVTGLSFVVSGLSSRVELVFPYRSHHGQLLL